MSINTEPMISTLEWVPVIGFFVYIYGLFFTFTC